MITHWDDVEPSRRERGHIAASWQSLTGANSVTTGVQRISIDPGGWATPLHLEGSEEEIFYVLSGSGVSFQWDGDSEEAFAVGAGRLPRPPRARARAHDRRRRRRSRRPRLRAAALRREHAAAAGRRVLARVDLGARGSARGSSLDAGGRRRPAHLGGAVGAAGAHRQRRRRAATSRDGPGETVGSEVARPRTMRPDRSGRVSPTTSCSPGMLMNPPHVHAAEEEIFVDPRGQWIAAPLPERARRTARSRSFPCARAARSRDPREPSGRTRSGPETTG